ncbi:Acyl-CoA carboxylase subunit beta OS=Streptomyces tendae OX=1932 GN=GUR47_36705 PE=4 SV=1 [Streptomyces tendae]
MVIGCGLVHGRRIAYAHDFRVFGGALGEAHAEKIHKVMDLADAAGAPVVGLSHGAGTRIQEGVTALAGYGGIFRRNPYLSVIPQISVVLHPCAGGAALAPALTDFVFMVRGTSQMFITGPDVVQAVTGEQITTTASAAPTSTRPGRESPGSSTTTRRSAWRTCGTCSPCCPRTTASSRPRCGRATRPTARDDALTTLVPADPQAVVRHARIAIEEIVDDGDYFEVHENWARNVVCALARLDGEVVGLVANQPAALAGVLDIHGSEKAARFVQTCDAFNIPLITLVDVPGFLPGVDQEHNGIIRHGAKLLYAYCNATVPRISLVVRKAYGGAYIVMDSRSIGADLSFAWPTNEIAVMGAEGAANVVFRREIAASDDPDTTRARLIKEYKAELMHPYYAAERGLVDDVIDPAETRSVLVRSLAMLRRKQPHLPERKHGNPPM